MKTSYKGHEIEAKRDRCGAGYDLVFYAIFDKKNELIDGGSIDSGESVREVMKNLKGRVDSEINGLEKL